MDRDKYFEAGSDVDVRTEPLQPASLWELVESLKKSVKNVENNIEQAIEKLENLDFSSYEQLLDWLKDYVELSANLDSPFKKEKVVGIFVKNGFTIVDSSEIELNFDDADSVAKYTINRVLNNLSSNSIIDSKNFAKMVNLWKVELLKKIA